VRIRPRYGWADLVLPEDRIAVLGEICAQIRHHERVFDGWGFGRRIAHGRGLSALFSGPSGTGKTLAAEVIAGQAGLDLYKVDLAGVVSKYIGETERNLARIFSEAHNSNAILFFDEADALFGKRSEVTDAHDRYANIETSYLLQRMEDYDGVVVLATNLRQNLDEAFTRRIRFLVDFPFPSESSRRQIWQSHLPPEAPLAPDIDCARAGPALRGVRRRDQERGAERSVPGRAGGSPDRRPAPAARPASRVREGRQGLDRAAGTAPGGPAMSDGFPKQAEDPARSLRGVRPQPAAAGRRLPVQPAATEPAIVR